MAKTSIKTTIKGKLYRDPEAKKTKSGKDFLMFSLGTFHKDTNADSGFRTDYHRVNLFCDDISQALSQMRPGAIIEVEGIPNVWESEYKGKKQKNISYAAFEWQVVDMHGVDENVKTKIGEVHSMVSKASPLDESLDEIPF